MYRIFPRVYFFVLCINIAVFFMASGLGITSIASDPFTSSTNVTVTLSDLPNLINTTDSSNTVLGNLTNPINATEAGGDDSPFFFIPDYFELPFVVLYYMIQFVTGGWVFTGIAIFGFPAYFLSGIQVIIGFWAIYTVAYYILGKG